MVQSADKPLTKSQTIAALAEKAGLKKQQVSDVLDGLLDLAVGEAKRTDKGFTLPGFGKLVRVERAERMGRNPATGETIQIPAKKVVKFRIAKTLKDSLLD